MIKLSDNSYKLNENERLRVEQLFDFMEQNGTQIHSTIDVADPTATVKITVELNEEESLVAHHVYGTELILYKPGNKIEIGYFDYENGVMLFFKRSMEPELVMDEIHKLTLQTI